MRSYGLEALTTDKAFGEEMDLGGSNRFLESVEVAMVNNAKATELAHPCGSKLGRLPAPVVDHCLPRRGGIPDPSGSEDATNLDPLAALGPRRWK